MKPHVKRMALALILLAVAMFFGLRAHAECATLPMVKSHAALKPQSWQGLASPAALLLVNDSNDGIVGLWHVTFSAKGNTGTGAPPDGAPIDNALITWHADGTELMNSARPPQDGNFCMGVWKKTGRSSYVLNHLAWAGNDTTNAPTGIGNPTGSTRILEHVTLSPNGNHYYGHFTLDAYDTTGTNVAHIIGVMSGTRITIGTMVSDIM